MSDKFAGFHVTDDAIIGVLAAVRPEGRQRKRYPYQQMMTPYEKFKSLQNAAQCLKPGITFQRLDTLANAMSDNEAARRLNQARATMFKTIYNRSKSAA